MGLGIPLYAVVEAVGGLSAASTDISNDPCSHFYQGGGKAQALGHLVRLGHVSARRAAWVSDTQLQNRDAQGFGMRLNSMP